MQIGGATTTVFLQAVDGGLGHVAVAGSGIITQNDKALGVLARAEAPIEGAKAFEGKKAGALGLGAFQQVLFRKWLLETGADIKKVTFAEVSFPRHPDVLKGGAIDAIFTGEPTKSRIVAAGVGKLPAHFNDNLKGELPIIVYSATREWASKNPAAATAFAGAIAESYQRTWLLTHVLCKVRTRARADARNFEFD